MVSIEPGMVLGKEVVESDGLRVGSVVDVGVHSARRVKYLVVEGARPREYLRLAVDRVERVGAETVVLKPR